MTASADGWRGIIGKGFTPDTAAALANAALPLLFREHGRRVLISHDGRSFGAEAANMIAVIAEKQMADCLLRVRHLPTPIASALLSDDVADIAFLVTASHNPACYNGIKIKAGRMGSVSGPLEQAIDAAFRRQSGYNRKDVGSSPMPIEPTKPAIAFCERHADRLLRMIGPASWAGRQIVIDGLGGVGGLPMMHLCRKLGAEVEMIGPFEPETFGGVQPDPTRPVSQQRCRRSVLQRKADLGILLDGDGDRVVFIGPDGSTWQTQEIAAAILFRAESSFRDQLGGAIIATTSTGTLIRRLASEQQRAMIETPIGFKHIASRMNAAVGSIGVGAVGDIGFQSFGTDRDPFATVALLARVFPDPRQLGREIDALKVRFGTAHLHWIETFLEPNQNVSAETMYRGLEKAGAWVEPCIDGRKYRFPDGQWALVRPSTTENGIRFYGEFSDRGLKTVSRIFGAKLRERALPEAPRRG